MELADLPENINTLQYKPPGFLPKTFLAVVVRVCSFVCCNGVFNSGFSFTKTKFEGHTPTRHKGI